MLIREQTRDEVIDNIKMYIERYHGRPANPRGVKRLEGYTLSRLKVIRDKWREICKEENK